MNNELIGVLEDNSFNVVVQITDTGPQGPEGPPGIDGKSLEFHWDGTKLGVRVEGETDYQHVDLKGPQGERGPQGPQGEKGEKGEKGDPGEKGEKGDKGDTGNGIASAVLNEDYTLTLTFTDGTSYTTPSIRGAKGDKGDKGDKGEKGEKGEKGTDGKDGYTPQKGVDYYTDADKAEIVSAVLAALPVYEGEVESV